jgi:hypothetical protein
VPSRWIRVVPASAPADGLEALRREAGVPEAFLADVLAEAQAAAGAPEPARERVDIPLVTIDPPGARDLDQAVHIGRRGDLLTGREDERFDAVVIDEGPCSSATRPSGAADRPAARSGQCGLRPPRPRRPLVQDGGVLGLVGRVAPPTEPGLRPGLLGRVRAGRALRYLVP